MANDTKITKLIGAINARARSKGMRPAITYQRYMQLAGEEVVPRPDRGNVDPAVALVDLFLYQKRLAEASGSLTLTDERTALTSIKKEQEKLKLETMRHSLVDREQAIQWVGNLVAESRTALLNFPRRMAEMLATLNDAREIETVIRKEIFGILTELGRPLHESKRRHKVRAAS